MNKSTIKIRLMKVDDFGPVVRIDEKVFKASRSEYYKLKFETAVQSPDHLPTSLVAEEEDGTVVGFVTLIKQIERTLPEKSKGYLFAFLTTRIFPSSSDF